MIPGTNATIVNKTFTNNSAERELSEITAALDDRFELYRPSIQWIIETADLLRKYTLLTGKSYEIKTREDSII